MSELQGQETLPEILAVLKDIAAAQDELLTVEQTAVRLSLSVPQLEARMRNGRLPKGRVWFEREGVGRYFSWRRLLGYMTSTEEIFPSEDADTNECIPQKPNRAGRVKHGASA